MTVVACMGGACINAYCLGLLFGPQRLPSLLVGHFKTLLLPSRHQVVVLAPEQAHLPLSAKLKPRVEAARCNP